jgi:hypothetical protein
MQTTRIRVDGAAVVTQVVKLSELSAGVNTASGCPVLHRDGGHDFYRPSTVERSQLLVHTPPMIVGLLSIAVATSLGAWGTMRLAVANPTARLPFWGSPPHKPSGTRFLNLVMISSLIFGTAQLFDGGNHPSQLWEIPVFLTFLAAGLVPSVIHNRRVGRRV